MRDLFARRLVLFACVGAMAMPVRAQLEFDITDFVGKRTPVAIVPFGWEGQGPEAPFDIDDIIGADLSRSGRFRPIPEGDMLQ
ncbi:MAG: Tol-Pal system protein TolB, partial [Pseudomonadota bacterium]|nr:Tol-Pal system protein TolB [Pseudomonadota bacterium]